MTFKIQAYQRIQAAEAKETNVRNLADSTLRDISNDASDKRQHLAERELERRQRQEKKKAKDEEKKQKPSLLTRTKEGTKNYLKENAGDIRDVSKEYLKYTI